MSRRTKVPAIPAIDKDNVSDVLAAIKAVVEVREGQIGDPLDRVVTMRDLETLNLATSSGTTTDANGVVIPVETRFPPEWTDGYDPNNDFTTPPAPTGLIAVGGFASVYLSWDAAPYRNHAYAEVWRADTDNLANAVKIGSTIGSLYADAADASKTYWYWVRFVSKANVTGPFNQTSGTVATTAIDVTREIERLTREVLDSEIYVYLNERIGKIELEQYNTQISLELLAEARARLDAAIGQSGSAIIDVRNITSDQATLITGLGTRVGDAESSILTLQTTTATQATSLTNLTTRVGTAESNISTLQTTTATQATSLTNLTTRVDTAESNISTLQTTTATQATSLTNLTTRVGTAESNITSLQTTTATQATSLTSLTTRVDTAESSISTLQTTTANQATSLSTLSSTVSGHTTSISTLQTATNGLEAQYSVKVDNNGFLAGFGLSSTVVDGTPFSSFVFNADRFSIVNPSATLFGISSLTLSGATASLTVALNDGPMPFAVDDYFTIRNAADGKWNGVFRVASVSGYTITFTITTSPTTPAVAVSGKTLKIGMAAVPFIVDGGIVYLNNAAIKTASITSAQIQSLVADKITAGTITAAIDLQAPKIRSGNITYANIVAGTPGFFLGDDGGTNKFAVGNGTQYLRWDGSDLVVRGAITATSGSFSGSIYAAAGTIGGSNIGSDYIQSTNFSAGSAGWRIKSDGTAEFGSTSIRGQITASQIDSRGLSIKDASGNIILAAGTALTGANIAVGYGVNVVPNADLGDGIGTLSVGYYTTTGAPTLGINLTNKRVLGESTAYITYSGSTGNGQIFGANVKNGTDAYFAVTPGQRYEFSAFLNVDRCIGFLTVAWHDSSGTYISEVASSTTTTTGDFTSLAGMTLVSGFATAPAGAVRALLIVRGQTDFQASPYVYFSRLYFGLATASQTELSPWSPGRGIAQITATNASTYIADLAVNTLQIAGNAVTVPVYATSASSVTISTYSSDGSTNTWYDIVSVVIDYGTVVSTAKGMIGFTIQHGSGGGGYWAIRWQVIRGDGTVIGFGEQAVSNNDVGKSTVSATVFDNAANSGARTYKLQIANYGNVGSARVVDAGAVIFGMGAKK